VQPEHLVIEPEFFPLSIGYMGSCNILCEPAAAYLIGLDHVHITFSPSFSRGMMPDGTTLFLIRTTRPRSRNNGKETCASNPAFSHCMALFNIFQKFNIETVEAGRMPCLVSSGGDFWKILSSSVDFPELRIGVSCVVGRLGIDGVHSC